MDIGLNVLPPLPAVPDNLESFINNIIGICEKHVFRQSSSIQNIISICSQSSGYDYFNHQIISLSNQIISETFESSNSIINLCKSVSELGISRKSVSTKYEIPVSERSCQTLSEISQLSKEISSQLSRENIKQEPENHNTFSDVSNENKTISSQQQNSPSFKKDTDKSGAITVIEKKAKKNKDTGFKKGVVYESDSEDNMDEEAIEELDDFVDADAAVEEEEECVEIIKKPIKNRERKKRVTDQKQGTSGKKKDLNTMKKEKKEIFYCSLCPKKTTSRLSIEGHELKHKYGSKIGNKYGFQCDTCPYTSLFASEFKNHLRTHTGERPFVCEICGNSYAVLSTLRGHQTVHLDYKKEKCPVCGHKCRTRKRLMVHMKIHSDERKYQCDTCGKRFRDSAYLRTHRRMHTDEYPFKCELCPQKFKYPNGLIRHKDTHTTEMKFKCHICGKQSKQKYNITVHMRTHHNIKPYPCEVCGESFSLKNQLFQHKSNNICGKTEILISAPLPIPPMPPMDEL